MAGSDILKDGLKRGGGGGGVAPTYTSEIIQQSAGTPASFKFLEGTNNGSNYCQLKAPSSIATSYNLVLPATEGSSGDVFVNNGSGTLTATTFSSGTTHATLIQSQTASASSSITFTSGISDTYESYLLYFEDVQPSTTGVILKLQVSDDGGSSWKATSYMGQSNTLKGNSTSYVGAAHSTYYLAAGNFGTYTAANTRMTGHVFITGGRKGVAGSATFMSGTFAMSDAGATVKHCGGGVSGSYPSTGAKINAFKFEPSTGTLTTGTFKLYGIRNS